jgi:hypothetical protein
VKMEGFGFDLGTSWACCDYVTSGRSHGPVINLLFSEVWAGDLSSSLFIWGGLPPSTESESNQTPCLMI